MKPYRPKDRREISFNMSRIRSVDAKTEVLVRSALHRLGLRFRKNVKSIAGRPDIVFGPKKVAVFIDGDFWHARVLAEGSLEKLRESLRTKNRDYWLEKFTRNRMRDLAVTSELEAAGWRVLRFWESDVKKNMDATVRQISVALQGR
ncbi:MAG: very short patch repair endonuclease [Rhizobiales bacterium]|nr:very short patch repair endonuclease [Hyphomicrobiales bacterium]